MGKLCLSRVAQKNLNRREAGSYICFRTLYLLIPTKIRTTLPSSPSAVCTVQFSYSRLGKTFTVETKDHQQSEWSRSLTTVCEFWMGNVGMLALPGERRRAICRIRKYKLYLLVFWGFLLPGKTQGIGKCYLFRCFVGLSKPYGTLGNMLLL